MTVVIDASVAFRWYFGTTKAERADALIEADERLIAPDLLIPEFANAAWKGVSFGDLSVMAAKEAIADIENEIDEVVPSVGLKDRALTIALELRHPAYDCFYLALAEARGCHLITADNRLLARCKGTLYARLVREL